MKIVTMLAAASIAALAYADEPAAKPAPAASEPKAPAVAAAPAAAQRPMRHERRANAPMRMSGAMMGDPVMRALSNPIVAEKLGLTPEQKAKLGDSAALRAKSRELNEKARKATERQMELLRAEKIDEAAVMAAIDEAFEARKALAKEQTKRLIVVRSVLTPDQVKAALAELQSLRGKRGPKAERPQPPPPPKDAPKAGK